MLLSRHFNISLDHSTDNQIITRNQLESTKNIIYSVLQHTFQPRNRELKIEGHNCNSNTNEFPLIKVKTLIKL